MMTRPSVFIGSSQEGKEVAQNISANLTDVAETTLWYQGVFGLNYGTLESLVASLDDFDFSILVLTPDDLIVSRGQEFQSPRDNVLFECGLFMGRLGRRRTFIIYDKDKPIKIPSDLAGVTLAPFKGTRKDNNLMAAVDEACHSIRLAIKQLGIRNDTKTTEPVSPELLLSELRGGIRKIDANIQQVINIIRNEKESPDSVFTERAIHYNEEKSIIAEHFLDYVLWPRIKYLVATSKYTKIRIIFDSGTTIAPILNAIGRKSEEYKEYWCRHIPVVTNNIKGIQNMLRYREHRNDRYAQLSISHFSVLPGKVLAAFEAIADDQTLDALDSYRNDGVYTIAVTTGNYILLDQNKFIGIARAGYHPDFKATLTDIANEVYVVAPLGKLLMWTGKCEEADKVNSLKGMLDRLNHNLNFVAHPRHQFAADTVYDLVTKKLVWKHPSENGEPDISNWLEKSVLVTTSRDEHCLFFVHFGHVDGQIPRKFRPDWKVGFGPYISTVPFITLPISRQGQFKLEVPHESLQGCAENYFFLPNDFVPVRT
ncbi:MAG: TIR domain-containing protein [Methylococcales bacterium]